MHRIVRLERPISAALLQCRACRVGGNCTIAPPLSSTPRTSPWGRWIRSGRSHRRCIAGAEAGSSWDDDPARSDAAMRGHMATIRCLADTLCCKVTPIEVRRGCGLVARRLPAYWRGAFCALLWTMGAATVSAAPLDLGALRGRVVYLDFWASWCVPCRQSFPWMESMKKAYEAQGLTVVAVNVDHDPALRIDS
jgi:hypothetical protein